jgi:hypothetical protein
MSTMLCLTEGFRYLQPKQQWEAEMRAVLMVGLCAVWTSASIADEEIRWVETVNPEQSSSEALAEQIAKCWLVPSASDVTVELVVIINQGDVERLGINQPKNDSASTAVEESASEAAFRCAPYDVADGEYRLTLSAADMF